MTKSEEGRKLQQDLTTAHIEFEVAVDTLEAAKKKLAAAEDAMESFWDSLDAPSVPPPAPVEQTKRHGRKPGSKNKPKGTVTITLAPMEPQPSQQTDFKPETFVHGTDSFEPLPGETLEGLFDERKWDKESRAHFIHDQPDKSKRALIMAFKRLVAVEETCN